MSKLDELKAKQAAELATAERQEAIRALLPIKPDAARVMLHYGKAHVYYKADALADALAILAAFDTAPFVQLRGTFLHHKPLEWISARDRESAKNVTDCFGAMLSIDGGKGFGPNAKLTKWARLETGELVEIQVELGVYPCGKGFPVQWHVRSRVRYDSHGNVTEAEHNPPTIAADLPMVRWSAGQRDAYHFSWVWTEPQTFAQEMARFMPETAKPYYEGFDGNPADTD